MGVPKRKQSKQRQSTRRAANRFHAAQLAKCPQCGSATRPHRVCPSCGYYRGRQIISAEAV